MNLDTTKLCNWELEKASYIISQALKLGMDLKGYGEIAVNPNSGYTYLWLEDYSFTLYMPICCDLVKSDIYVLWTNSDDGEEIEQTLDTFSNLSEIEGWCSDLEKSLTDEL